MNPPVVRLPTCRICGEPGLHGTTDECIKTLKAAIARLSYWAKLDAKIINAQADY